MESRSFNAPRSPQLGNRDGEATPRGEVRGRKGEKKGVESQMSRDMFPSPAYWTPPFRPRTQHSWRYYKKN